MLNFIPTIAAAGLASSAIAYCGSPYQPRLSFVPANAFQWAPFVLVGDPDVRCGA